jgi:hypothetical protein
VQSGARLTLRNDYESRADHVAAASMPDYLANVDRVDDLISYGISVPSRWTPSALSTSPSPAAVVKPSANMAGSPAQKSKTVTSWVMLAICGAIGWLLWGRALRYRRPAPEAPPIHRCAVCGKTDQSDPDLEFRVAGNGNDYCSRHLPA